MIDKFYLKNKKYFYYWMLITSILECLFLFKIMNTRSNIIILAGILYIPLVTYMLCYMLNNWHNAIYMMAVMYPMIPLNGYIFNRIGLIDYQWVSYIVLDVFFLISIINSGILKKLKFKIELNFDNIIIILLMSITNINILFSYNKSFSLLIILFAVIPSFLYFCFISFLPMEDKKKIMGNILLAVCSGVIFSSIPDFVTFLVLWSIGLKTARIYGPLGSNFILGYSLLIYPIVIIKSKTEIGLRRKVYKALLLILIISISSQFSRGILLSMVVLFFILLIDKKNYKYYSCIFLIIMVFLSINVFQRPEISKNPNLVVDKSNSQTSQAARDKKFIESQSNNRKPIWNAAIKMFKDYPLTGVGIGNFQFFYKHYSNSNRTYLDAHNFLLTNLDESGLIFTSILILYLIKIIIDSIIGIFKFNNNTEIKLFYLSILAGLIPYLVFGNITGEAFQCANEIHSYTPIFVMCFFIFYYNTYKKTMILKYKNNVMEE